MILNLGIGKRNLMIQHHNEKVGSVLTPYAVKFNEICKQRGWKRNWSNGGCYLHLEVSEFIEALRNKGHKEEEAGDIFFVFLAMLDEHNISVENVFDLLLKKLDNLDNHPNILDKSILHTGHEM